MNSVLITLTVKLKKKTQLYITFTKIEYKFNTYFSKIIKTKTILVLHLEWFLQIFWTHCMILSVISHTYINVIFLGKRR